jgi:type I restriction enzyme R subunit
MNNYTEDKLVEQPAIKIFESLGYGFVNAFKEKFTGKLDLENNVPELGRNEMDEVVLVPKLREALERFNTDVSNEAIDLAIEELIKDRSLMSPTTANEEVYKLIRDGVNVSILDKTGKSEDIRIKVIDFEDVSNNDFLLTSQLWISGEMYKRRADLIGFVNGLPLIFIELKAAHKDLKDAYQNNLRDYKDTIPQLFWYNAFVIVSNGIESKIGTITSEFEHFSEWKKINSEGEKGIVSLETIIKGTCDKDKFLDLFENFILYNKEKGHSIKLLAKNHQYLGVNNAIQSLQKVKENEGRLGVFWHTQGSGKSYSMILFSQKVLRKFEGNYTFLVITDRLELDGQIYKNFANVGAVTEPEKMVHAQSVEHLRELLGEDHRNIFSIIHKFQLQAGEKEFPVLSERENIIVMTDEAHRSQYDTLALNMRSALPKASFIGFTGTPLIEGEEQETKKTFGDYVSIYDFKQSVEDGATVPLFYENRIPELQLNNEALEEDLDNLLNDIDLNTDEEKKLEREFSREYHLITREDRLDKISQDLMAHFNNRGTDGKAMFVCIDRLTAIKMYEKIKAQPNCPDVAVVFSSSQNEVSYFKEKGFDITPHRLRMNNEDLEVKFKEPSDPLKIVIVCNMWLTGFDVPGLSTIYLDKPMKNHTLMQTIARANRVYPGKTNGLIVDYIGVFRNLQKALAVYAIGSGGEELPIKPKEKLIENLRLSLREGDNFCEELGFSIANIEEAESLEKLSLIENAVNEIISKEEIKNKFLGLSYQIVKTFGAILPDREANQFFSKVKAFRVLSDRVRILTKQDIDVADIVDKIENILDDSIEADGYKIKEKTKITDLSKIDFEKLRAYFDKSKKNIETEKLRQSIEQKLKEIIRINPMRLHLAEKFQKLIDEYNSGAKNIEEFFDALMKFSQVLSEEEKRNLREGLSDEELAIFDLLYKANLSEKEKNQIKKVARDILEKLKNKLVLDWRKKQQARADVKVAIDDVLYTELPENYSTGEYQMKIDLVYRHVYDSYWGEGNSVYAYSDKKESSMKY